MSTEGDAFFAVFPSAVDAVRATVDAQQALAAAEWPDGLPVRVRMGLHTGEGVLGGDNYAGVDVNRAARIAAAGHGGQVVISDATRALVQSKLPDGVELRDLGEHRLKDLREPEHLHQLVMRGAAGGFSGPAHGGRRAHEPGGGGYAAHRPGCRARRACRAAGAHAAADPHRAGRDRQDAARAWSSAGAPLDRFSDGVYFVPLETFAERSPAAVAIGQAVGTRAAAERDPEEALLERLAAKQLLLILDNFEQLVGAAPLVARDAGCRCRG